MASGWESGCAGSRKSPGYISETVRCRKLILGRAPFRACATSYCDLNFTFDLDVVTLSFKTFSGLYLGSHKVQMVDTW